MEWRDLTEEQKKYLIQVFQNITSMFVKNFINVFSKEVSPPGFTENISSVFFKRKISHGGFFKIIFHPGFYEKYLIRVLKR